MISSIRSSRILAAGAAIVFASAACSSGATTAPTTAPAAPTSAPTTAAPATAAPASAVASAAASAAASGGGLSACVSTATQRVQDALKPIQLTLPSEPVDMTKIKGKEVWAIEPVLSIPVVAQWAAGFKAAALAAGLKPVIFDGKGNVDTFNQGVQSAVNAHAAGIMLQGINPALVSGPLAKATAAGIKIVDSLNGDPDQPLTGGVLAHSTVSYSDGGKLMADWVLYDSQCQADVVLVTHTIYTVYKNMEDGFRSEYTSLCPTCKIEKTENLAPDQIATLAGTLTSTLLQRYPNLNYIVPFDDVTATQMNQAIETGSHPAKVISHDGALPNIDTIRAGNVPQAATVANPPGEAFGWAQVDQLGRLIAGQQPVNEILPQQLFTKDNLPATDANLFPGYANYQSQYKQLWGVQ